MTKPFFLKLRWSFMALLWLGCLPALQAEVLVPDLASNLVCRYDFEHPATTNAAQEMDLGFSGTALQLINGGAAMRVGDGAYPGSTNSLQTQQLNSTVSGNDDWKAGVYQTNGLATLSAFASVREISLMGWVKPTGTNPNLNSGTLATNDYYNAIGLFGLLSGTSEGHGVRALLEVLTVSGNLRLVALGRRIDTGVSLTLATTNDWHTLLPDNVWTHLAATFDFDNGTMALFRNGQPLPASYTTTGDAWSVIGGAEPDLTSATSPAGIKVGGSYPQNTQEFNAFNGRFDDLMFFNRTLTAAEVWQQYSNFFAGAALVLGAQLTNQQLVLTWPETAAEFALEQTTNLATTAWSTVSQGRLTNNGVIQVNVPLPVGANGFFRLRRP